MLVLEVNYGIRKNFRIKHHSSQIDAEDAALAD